MLTNIIILLTLVKIHRTIVEIFQKLQNLTPIFYSISGVTFVTPLIFMDWFRRRIESRMQLRWLGN